MTNDGLDLIRKQVRLKSAVSLESLYAQRAALVNYIDKLHGIVHDLRRENEALRAALHRIVETAPWYCAPYRSDAFHAAIKTARRLLGDTASGGSGS